MFNAYYITRVSLPGWLVAGTKGLGFKSPQQQFSGHYKIGDIGILYHRFWGISPEISPDRYFFTSPLPINDISRYFPSC